MHFLSTGQFDTKHESYVWSILKEAFSTELGNAWHNLPITTMKTNPVIPDIVILHPEWGLNVIEVKGCSINQIDIIEGDNWFMKDFYDEIIQPFLQVRNHMFSMRDRLKTYHESILLDDSGELKVSTNYYVALPSITQSEWNERFSIHPSVDIRRLIFKDDLYSQALKLKFVTSSKKQKPLSDIEWNAIIASIAGSDALESQSLRPAKRINSRYAIIKGAREQMIRLDDNQHRIGIQIPDGPQRIRGLAGTGKTVVLAQKVAHMHLQHPDWKIAYTFYTRSLYAQVRQLIIRFVRSLSNDTVEEPNWDNLKVLHAWGNKNLPGFYFDMCKRTYSTFRTFSDARDYFVAPASRLFDLCCYEILTSARQIPVIYDAIIIDEAQDIGHYYARLCYNSLKDPKRVIWAYDEIQSLDALEVPSPEDLFGNNSDGQPLVSLDGSPYNGEVERDETLSICYRNPRPVLVTAHAFGLGLHRKPQGAIQFIPSVRGWNDIGYELEYEKGKSLTVNQPLDSGTPLILHRPRHLSPHYLEDKVGYHSVVSHYSFNTRLEELQWIADDIIRNIREEEVLPHDIAVISLDTRDSSLFETEFDTFSGYLKQHSIESVILTDKGEKNRFTLDNHVTFTGTFRAKGNEAWIVYVYGFENADSDDNPIKQRNIAFTAMTRSKGWLILTGIGDKAKVLFREIDSILEETGRVRFLMPDMSKIERYLQQSKEREQRHKTQTAEEITKRAFTALTEIDPSQLSEDIKELIKKLGEKFTDK